MRYIANIITNSKFDGKGLFNVVKTIEEIDSRVPSLIIGWEYTKKMFDDVSIINWQITDNIYWTFGKREKRERQEEDIRKFTKICIEKFITSVEYKFSSMLIDDIEKKKELFKSITSKNVKTVYLDGDMLYFYEDGTNCVHGVLLSDIDYEGKNRNAILSKLHLNNGKFLNGIQSGITYEVRNILKDNKYVIPYMYS